MSELQRNVTPLTRGIIWFVEDEGDLNNPFYAEIDYLLDGLLTQNLQHSGSVSSRVIVGKNFNKSFYLMIVKERRREEIESFLSLFKNDLLAEEDILVIDQAVLFAQIKTDFKEISSHLRFLGDGI